MLAVPLHNECLVLVEGEEVIPWVSVNDDLPVETQAYGCTTDAVLVKNENSGYKGMAFMARATDGNRWFTDLGEFELYGVTHWSYV